MSRDDKIRKLMDELTPRVLPAGWALTEDFENAKVYRSASGLAVISEVAFYPPDNRGAQPWLHVSTSRAERLPSWEDLREVKDLFCGRDRLALQVLPPEAEYVNAHPYVLHLWVALGPGRPVPDFRRGGLV